MRQAAQHAVLAGDQVALVQLGVKENCVRQCGQNPSVSPGRPSRERPTGLAHAGLAQYRLSSGTSGLAMTAVAGSR